MNLAPLFIFVATFLFACTLTGLLYSQNGTLGNIVKYAPGVNYSITPYYIGFMFLLVFTNTVMFATDAAFQHSWALWPFVGLQTAYAVNWTLYLYLEYRGIFVMSTYTSIIINENLFIQVYASIVICIACIGESAGLQYTAIQLAVLAHTAIYDYALYITCFSKS
tara:strand:+ start:222 stop:716 length:495 start_codon:yes stop_codon:yes gene_type:complete